MHHKAKSKETYSAGSAPGGRHPFRDGARRRLGHATTNNIRRGSGAITCAVRTTTQWRHSLHLDMPHVAQCVQYDVIH